MISINQKDEIKTDKLQQKIRLALPSLAASGIRFNPTQVRQKRGRFDPRWNSVTWPSNSWPSGRDNRMECNGKPISRAIYPELVIVIPVGYLFRESTIVNWRT